MQAQVIDEYGGPKVLQLKEVDTPVPGRGEVRVRVAFVSLNPIEWKIRSGAFASMLPMTFPAVLGNEVSGVIDDVGEDAGGFAVGDRVAGFVRGGGDAEYVLTTPDRLAAVPAALSLRRAATLPQGVETARRSLSLLGVQPGDTVLINAAAGSVGSAAVQLLVAQGVAVIGTASPDNHDYLRSLGAIPVEYGDGLLDRVASVAPDGVDAALDGGARGFVDQVLAVLPPGRIVTIADFGAAAKGVQLASGDPLALYADSFRSIMPLAAEGHFATEIAAEFPLAELASAQAMSEVGHLRGKILVRVADIDAENTDSASGPPAADGSPHSPNG